MANFKSHSELLAILFSTWQQQRANEHMGLSQDGHSSIETLTRRFNDFFLQFQDESQDSNRHAAQIRGIVQRGETMWKDIRQQMNDQTILAADSQQVLNLLVSMFEQLRKNMTWQFDKLEDARKADMKRRILKLISNQREPQAAHHESFRKMRTPGTGNWLLEDSVVWSWLHEPLPSACLVWLRGRMGAGESIQNSSINEMFTGSRSRLHRNQGRQCLHLSSLKNVDRRTTSTPVISIASEITTNRTPASQFLWTF